MSSSKFFVLYFLQVYQELSRIIKNYQEIMTPEELTKQCMALQKECNDKQMALRIQFAKEHNPVKVGDIVTDYYHTIRVENMSVCGHPIPYMRYTGIAITKKGVPAKRQPVPREPVYQERIETINGQPYTYEFNDR